MTKQTKIQNDNETLGKRAIETFNESLGSDFDNQKLEISSKGKVQTKNGETITGRALADGFYSAVLMKPVTVAIHDLLNMNWENSLLGCGNVKEAVNLLYTLQFTGILTGSDYTGVASIDDLNPASPSVSEATYKVLIKRVFKTNTQMSKMLATAITPAMIGELLMNIVKRLKDTALAEVQTKFGTKLITNTGNHNHVVDTTNGPDGTTPSIAEDYIRAAVAYITNYGSEVAQSIPGITDTTLKQNAVKFLVLYDSSFFAEVQVGVQAKLFNERFVDIANVKPFNFKSIVPTSNVKMVIIGYKEDAKKFTLIKSIEDSFSIFWPTTMQTTHNFHLWYDIIANALVPSAIFGPAITSANWGQTNLKINNSVADEINVGTIQFKTLKDITDGNF